MPAPQRQEVTSVKNGRNLGRKRVHDRPAIEALADLPNFTEAADRNNPAGATRGEKAHGEKGADRGGGCGITYPRANNDCDA